MPAASPPPSDEGRFRHPSSRLAGTAAHIATIIMKYNAFELMIHKLSPCGKHLFPFGRPACFPLRPLRSYATQNTLGGAAAPSRKQITVASDDGRVRWADLSTREKAARTTQQTFNFGIILAGMVMTVCVHSARVGIQLINNP